MRRFTHKFRLVWLLGGSAVLFVGWCATVFYARGWLFPVRVASASMAPALCGPSFSVLCPDCQFSFLMGGEWSPEPPEFVCPNCGHLGQAYGAAMRPGQRVIVERFAFGRAPGRFDTVVAKSDISNQLITKRILGLPGESISIERGDVLIDGKQLCKAPSQYVESAIVVQQDRYRPSSQASLSRWRTKLPTTDWSQTETGHVWRLTTGRSNTDNDWLTYHHAEMLPPPHPRGRASVMFDNCPFNQSASRVLNRVSDSAVVCTARWATDGTIFFQRDAIDQSWLVAFDTATRQTQLFHSTADAEPKLLATSPATDRAEPSCEHSFLFGYWDGRFQFVSDGQHLIEIAAAVQTELSASTQPFAIRASQMGELRVRNLLVSRDVFYTDPYGTSEAWSFGRELGPDEYLTLGDNSPVSRDARQVPELGVFRRDQLIGRARLWLE